jgi:hypothetical protein
VKEEQAVSLLFLFCFVFFLALYLQVRKGREVAAGQRDERGKTINPRARSIKHNLAVDRGLKKIWDCCC